MKSVEKYLYEVGCPILMLLGTIGCILRFFVFTHKTLRKNPCSIYFIAYNITNFIFIYSSLISITLSTGYNIDLTVYHTVICRLRLYVAVLSNNLSPFYLILASIDRILVTSRNALTRRRSTHRFACICILICTLFWSLFHCHLLIFSNIIQLAPNYFLCYFQPGVQLAFMGYYQFIKEIIAFIFMTICGLWPIYNIRKLRHTKVAPHACINGTPIEILSHATAKDRQMIFMLLADIVTYTLFTTAFTIFMMYQQITQNQIKTTEHIQIEYIIRNFCLFSMGIPFCIGCYTDLLVSKTFRTEVRKLFVWK